MDDITAPRIEPLAHSNDLDKHLVKEKPARKHEKPGKPSPAPSVETDDLGEDAHQIDELA
jgi:hypothetical protein